jgi:hypothetical protein
MEADGSSETAGNSREIRDSKMRFCLFMEVSMQELLIGDPAPRITLAEFLKGTPFPDLEIGKVYVLEFWRPGAGHARRTCRIFRNCRTNTVKRTSSV